MTMLKGIPAIISPQLLKVLALMGHGDFIVLADANFPSASIAHHCPYGLINADGHNIPDLLKGILQLLPLDTYVDTPVKLMSRVESDKNLEVPIRGIYQHLVNESEGREIVMEKIERMKFYEEAKKAFCIVSTGKA